MFNLEQIKDGVLKRFMIQIPSGTTLFKQNDKGNTLYILIEGTVKLSHKVGQNAERTIMVVGPGEIIGEKTLCVAAPYRRAFTALAETDVVALEFDAQSIKNVAAKMPDFSLKLLQVVVERLDKANAFVAVLQIGNAVERITQYLMFLCEHVSKASGTGVDISVTAEELTEALNVEMNVAEGCLKDLVAAKVLTPKEKGYFVSDENLLLGHVSTLKQKFAA